MLSHDQLEAVLRRRAGYEVRVLPDEEDEADAIGSLSQSAEAMRLSAAAPARNTSVGGDYEG